MMRFPIAALAVLAMSCGLARAQLLLPGAVGPAPPGAQQPDNSTPDFSSSAAAVVGRPLRLDGNQGQLLFSARGKLLRIDKFSLPGEVISTPSRKCLIEIVGKAPIETKSLGRPDGPERYAAEIPACPFSFDLLDGAVLVPAQSAACVFQAADCQASPSGLWGPDGDNLESDAKSILRQRALAEIAAAGFLRTLEARLKGRPEAEDVAREQSDFVARRDDVCRDYEKEAAHGFCVSRMAQWRAAQLKARVDALDRRPAGQD
jgi:hypothetical protein